MTSDDRLQYHWVRLVVPPNLHGVAVGMLGAGLGLNPSEAAHRLARGILGDDFPADEARRLQSILSAAGLPVTVGQATTQGRKTLSVQLSVWADARRVARRLAKVLDGDASQIASGLGRAGGLVFTDLTASEHDRLVGLVRPVRGTVLASSDPDAALFDIFATRPLDPAESRHLSGVLRITGSAEEPLTGAIAGNLTPALCRYILSRTPDLDLLAIDQTFQRFDILLTGTSGWVTRDLADFLAARTQQPRARFETLSPASPVTLDLGLTRTVARQFCADYAAIGLFVRPVLSGRAANP